MAQHPALLSIFASIAMALFLTLCPGALAEPPHRASATVAASDSAAPPPTGVPTRPMSVVRMRAKDNCGRVCPEWIVAQGMITAETPKRFRDLLQQMGKSRLPVVLDSSGGDLDAALAVGRMIRTRGLATLVGSSMSQGCAPRDQTCKPGGPHTGYVTPTGTCSGTCLFVLAGGAPRAGYWMAEASLPAPEAFKTRKAGGDAEAVIGFYLAEMGISPGLIPRVRRSSLPLDRAEMLHFGLSTGRQRVEDFTGSSICMGPKPAANCVATIAPMPQVAKAAAPVLRSAARPAKRAVPPRRPQVIILGGIDEM